MRWALWIAALLVLPRLVLLLAPSLEQVIGVALLVAVPVSVALVVRAVTTPTDRLRRPLPPVDMSRERAINVANWIRGDDPLPGSPNGALTGYLCGDHDAVDMEELLDRRVGLYVQEADPPPASTPFGATRLGHAPFHIHHAAVRNGWRIKRFKATPEEMADLERALGTKPTTILGYPLVTRPFNEPASARWEKVQDGEWVEVTVFGDPQPRYVRGDG